MTAWNDARAQFAGRLLELIVMRLISEALHVAAALGVADLLATGAQSAEQLAQATGRANSRCGASCGRSWASGYSRRILLAASSWRPWGNY